MSPETPARIGPYAVVSRLGKSESAPVYKVTDSGGRTLAVKLYPGGESEDLRGYRRAALERAASLRHPAIVAYKGSGEHEGRVFAVMELDPGTTLRAALQSRSLPLHRTLRIMRQIAGGLDYLHRQGMVHGCLNPSRVLVPAAGDNAKIMEPAMCPETRRGATAATATMQVASSSRYLAPEVLRAGAAADPRADIYSLGVLLYEALTGRVPESRFKLPSQESDTAPPALDEVILRCLRQEPAARYRTAAEVVAAIDRVLETVPGGFAHQLEDLTSTARGILGGGAGARRGWGWLLAALIALIAVAAALLLLARR